MKLIDTKSMEDQEADEICLVNRAAASCFEVLETKLNINHSLKIVVICANSNNSSDGYKLADILLDKGYSNTYVISAGDVLKMNATCRYFHDEFEKRYKNRILDKESSLNDYDLIIDSLIGVGLHGELRDNIKTIVSNINKADTKVVSIDLPTGLDGDTGTFLGECIEADFTIAINNLKYGHLLNDGPDMCGEIYIADIGLNEYPQIEHIKVINEDSLTKNNKRKKNANKYDFGSVLVIGSSKGMAGAGIMASISALKAGAGLVTLACPIENYDIVAIKAPLEIMTRELRNLDDLLNKKTTVVFGPGLGRNTDYSEVLSDLLGKEINLVVDADGLYHLSKIEKLNEIKKCCLILTPHVGEAATLLNKTSKEIKSDLYKSCKEIQKKYEAIVVLKGHNTLIMEEDTYISLSGNSGMASAGSGDVLAGMVAGVIGKTADIKKVVRAVYLHGLAGDIAKEEYGESSLTATDIINNIAKAIKNYD